MVHFFGVECPMKVTIILPDEIAKRVYRLPDKDAFVTRAVEDALAHEPEAAAESGRSRWALLVERIEKDAQSLGDYREAFDRDRREFRESFRFRHDDEG
ncbi:MAG TPA: hypothetical protein VEW48_25345 [Thermoanaerobaculia bacterium]|nr:hypothetical protein [Thermoanaerobaculia bacterium]